MRTAEILRKRGKALEGRAEVDLLLCASLLATHYPLPIIQLLSRTMRATRENAADGQDSPQSRLVETLQQQRSFRLDVLRENT